MYLSGWRSSVEMGLLELEHCGQQDLQSIFYSQSVSEKSWLMLRLELPGSHSRRMNRRGSRRFVKTDYNVDKYTNFAACQKSC